MATYNGARFVIEQLASIANQSVPPDEIIISDDASNDGTSDLVKNFRRTSKIRIELIQNRERFGYSRNFISAVSHASGQVIFLSDQDDIWRGDKIEVMLHGFKSSNFLLLTHDLSIVDSDALETFVKSYFSKLERNSLPFDSNMKGCASAFKRQLISIFGWPTDDNWTYDKWLCLMASTFGLRGFVNEPLVKYRMHDQNASAWLPRERSILELLIWRLSAAKVKTRSEMNLLVSRCVDADIIHDLQIQIGQYRTLAPERAQATLAAIERRMKVLDLQQSEAYTSSFYRRLMHTIELFRAGAYDSSGGIPGCLADILGKRPSTGIDIR